MSRPPGGWPALFGVAALAVLATLLISPPAGWADALLARNTAGRLRLAQAEGSLWEGRGRLVLADARAAGDEPAAGAPLQGVVLPGTLAWKLSPLPLVIGMLDAELKLDGMQAPLRLSGRGGELRGSAGSLLLPPTRLDRLGSPWNTVQPNAALALQWEPFTLRPAGFEGRASLELRDVASAMSPVRPLGAYRVDINGTGPRADLNMGTLVGPLKLEGTGTWNAAQGLRFIGAASADGPERAQIAPLLGLLGRREGDRIIIRIGA